MMLSLSCRRSNAINLNKYYRKPCYFWLTYYHDYWKGYLRLDKHNYEHSILNHSIHGKDPETDVNTNKIKGLLSGINHKIKPGNRTKDIKPYLELLNVLVKSFKIRK